MTDLPPFYDSPQAAMISVSGLRVSAYMLCAHVGFAVGCFIAIRRAARHGMNPVRFAAILPVIYVGAVVGARLLSVVADGHWEMYRRHPMLILQVWRGGLVFYGGLVGGVLAAVAASHFAGISLGTSAEISAPGTALGVAIARYGCLINGCCYGKPTTWPIGVTYWNFALHPRPIGVPLHPSPIYESIGLVAIAIWLLRRTRSGEGRGVAFVHFVWMYAILRFVVEFTRADERGALGPLSTSQVISLVVLVGVGAIAWRARASHRRQHTVPIHRLMDMA